MRRKSYFKHLDFNKDWTEEDWEKFFQLQDEYYTQKLDPTLILRLRSRSARPALLNIDQALSELGLQSDIPIIKELHRKSAREEDMVHDPLKNPVHVSREGSSLETLPLFTEAYAFAHELNQELDRMKHRKRAPVNTRPRTDLKGEHNALKLHACWSALNIALGHKIGYDADTIRGNIAKCKRALRHADACLGLMNQLSKRSKSSKLRKELFAKSVRLRNSVSIWIDSLRSTFDTREHT